MPSRSYFHQIKVLTLQAFCLRLSLKNTNHLSVWNYNNDSGSSCLFYTKKHPVSTHHIRLLSKRNIIFHLDIQGLLPEVFSHKPSLSSSHKPELHLLPSSIPEAYAASFGQGVTIPGILASLQRIRNGSMEYSDFCSSFVPPIQAVAE